jgi:hypothetical protein
MVQSIEDQGVNPDHYVRIGICGSGSVSESYPDLKTLHTLNDVFLRIHYNLCHTK